MIGAIISNYRILSLLGSGGMGVVYEAEDTILQRKVAIKFLSSEFAESIEAARRLKREARTLSALNHPNICTVYAFGGYRGQPYLVQELLVGETFQQVIDNRKLSPQEVIALATQIADGLRAAHETGLVHRDIKPANLFLTRESRPKILDFGLAGQTVQLLAAEGNASTMAVDTIQFTTPGKVVGTLDYMSPEQIRGEQVSAASDIFSLGIVLYQLLIGHHPFRKPTLLETAGAILMMPLDSGIFSRDLIQLGLDRVLNKMLARDPAARYPDGAALLADLKQIKFATVGQLQGELPVPNGKTKPSVAVLPFVNLSADPENEYFCEGLAEELVSALSRVEGLQVAAWNSAFRFHGTDVNIREAGLRLGVGALLEGSLRKSGTRLRVNAKLLDVHNGYSLWSERYDAEMQDVFAIQEQLAEAIVSQLVERLGVQPKQNILRPATRDVEAYNLYLKGRYFWNRRSPADLYKAVESFQQAIARDERYAPALAGLGDCYVIAAIQGMESPAGLIPLARAAVSGALMVQPEMPEALTTLACMEAIYDWNWTAAEQRFRHAISLNPQYGTAHHWYASNVLLPLGRFAEAREQIEQAAANDPLAPAIQIMAGLIAWYEGDTARAIREYRRALEMDAAFALGHYFLGQALEQAGSILQAIDSLERALELSPGSSEIEAALARANAVAGHRDAAEAMLSQLCEKSQGQYVSPSLLAQVLMGLERSDEAIAQLEHAFAIKATDLVWLKVRPAFERIRTQPRVQAILAAMGLA